MPYPRRRPRQRAQHVITDEVIDAFLTKDWNRLRKALGLDFASYSPLTAEECPGYGHPPERPVDTGKVIDSTWDLARELRAAILEEIGRREAVSIYSRSSRRC